MATSSMSDTNKNEQSDEDLQPMWCLARHGIKLLINNQNKEAEALFKLYPDNLTMHAGYAFAVFMDALMSFEEDKLTLALATLKETERRCTADNSWLKAVKSKVFGADLGRSLADELETQIILADSHVCMAVLIFLQQEVSGYFKGGWVLRKAWKIYHHVYHDILALYKQNFGEVCIPEAVASMSADVAVVSSTDMIDDDNASRAESCKSRREAISNGYTTIPQSQSAYHIANSNNTDDISSKSTTTQLNFSMKKSKSVNSALYERNVRHNDRSFAPSFFGSNLFLSSYFSSTFHFFTSSRHVGDQIEKETIERLMGAISFGYGLFQLGISLLPPALLRFTNLFGFCGDRKNGIACLMYSRLGSDMRAPLATLSLLWYHTIVRPFYALDGSNVKAGVEAATLLIEESKNEYRESALFLFFEGRVHRLNSNIPEALSAFKLSDRNSTQCEIQQMAKHEVGWCYLIQHDYANAEVCFTHLKQCSRWSRPFYTYLSAICAGSTGKLKEIAQMRSAIALGRNLPKRNLIDEFLQRRFRSFPATKAFMDTTDEYFWKLFVYELLYLWNTLPSCDETNIAKIIEECKLIEDEHHIQPMVAVSKLIEGNCYGIQKNYQKAVEAFRACLEARKDMVGSLDAHISAFAQYELASLLIRNDETKNEGRLLLQHMGQYKDYDFENRLNVRVHSLLKQV